MKRKLDLDGFDNVHCQIGIIIIIDYWNHYLVIVEKKIISVRNLKWSEKLPAIVNNLKLSIDL